jgi:hypothetical protein
MPFNHDNPFEFDAFQIPWLLRSAGEKCLQVNAIDRNESRADDRPSHEEELFTGTALIRSYSKATGPVNASGRHDMFN